LLIKARRLAAAVILCSGAKDLESSQTAAVGWFGERVGKPHGRPRDM